MAGFEADAIPVLWSLSTFCSMLLSSLVCLITVRFPEALSVAIKSPRGCMTLAGPLRWGCMETFVVEVFPWCIAVSPIRWGCIAFVDVHTLHGI